MKNKKYCNLPRFETYEDCWTAINAIAHKLPKGYKMRPYICRSCNGVHIRTTGEVQKPRWSKVHL